MRGGWDAKKTTRVGHAGLACEIVLSGLSSCCGFPVTFFFFFFLFAFSFLLFLVNVHEYAVRGIVAARRLRLAVDSSLYSTRV